MKKIICLILAVMLLTGTALAAVEYTLPEKWQRQVEFGNGIKGTITMNASGTAEWAQLLQPLSGVPLQIRAIHSDDRFQYRVYLEKGEEMVGLTQLYGDSKNIYLQSALADGILMLPTGGDLLDSVAGENGTNPDLYSAIMNIMSVPQTSWDSKWVPALEEYESHIELWLEDYASAPSVKRGENGASVLVRYDVPADMIKAEIKALWEKLLQDDVLLPLVKAQMTQAQKDAYLNPNLMYYYAQVIDALPLGNGIVMEREMTAKGEALRTDMQFPLAVDGWTDLRVTQEGDVTTLSLAGEEESVQLSFCKVSETPDSTAYQGSLRLTKADQNAEGTAVAFKVTEIRSNSVDEDTRSHDVTTWNISLAPDAEAGEGNWAKFDPLDVYAKVHLHSKSQQNLPVTVEVELGLQWADAELNAALKLITRSPWVLDELPTEGAVDISTLQEGELLQRLTDMGLNGLTVLMMNQDETIPLPDATSTDL